MIMDGRGADDERVEHWRRTGERPIVAVWTPLQIGTFLDAAMSHRLYPLYHLLAYRGLRRGEARGIAWPDLDLDAAGLPRRRRSRSSARGSARRPRRQG